jgi:hypothetical protein
MTLSGTPSDDVADILAAGRGDITTLFVSMARRHPEGRDAEYLRWHTLDHRPEQHRLAGVRASMRLVSTPECRAARASSNERFDDIDHVMTYFFTDQSGLTPFNELSTALGGADRKLPLLPPVQRGVYTVSSKVAAPLIKTGADVLPWWPIRGVYLMLEADGSAPVELLDIDGVGGIWSAASQSVDKSLASARAGQTISYFFLDQDPVVVANELLSALKPRDPLFAAPFYPVIPYDWDRYVP